MIEMAAMVLLTGLRFMAVKVDPDFPPPGPEAERVISGIEPGFAFDEVIPSWNVQPAQGAVLKVELRAHGVGFTTNWYSLGTWSLKRDQRTSAASSEDQYGKVLTDTLRLNRMARSVDIKLTLRNEGEGQPMITLLGLAFRDRSALDLGEPIDVESEAWGRTIPVPKRSQGAYANGSVLCSPTSLSMVLWHWADRMTRPELNKDVPEIVEGVWDAAYRGAGNWPFNTAFAGSLPGLRSYVSRFSGLKDLESWITMGLPVICSVDLDQLRGKPSPTGSGHLVVLVGFSKSGDPIFNDPAYKDEVRHTYSRENFEKAWKYSGRTVYLVYPVGGSLPPDPHRLWTFVDAP